jgi:lipoprotein-anchoring transpeptidase ErfK/SrfK
MKGMPSVKIALPVLVAVLAAPTAASAQVPTTPTSPTPPQGAQPQTPAPAPAPAGAKLTAFVKSGLIDHGRHYVLRGDRVLVTGRLKPAVGGQKVLVELLRKGRRVGAARAKVGKDGRYSARLRVRRTGGLVARATHKKTARQKAARSKWVHFSSLTPGAGIGSGGEKVKLLQRALARLHYVTSRGGSYDAATARAVLTYRKVNGMARVSSASKTIFRRLWAGRGGYRLRYPKAGKHVEFDWSRQVLVLARGGEPERIYHASSGKPSTPTVFGTFHFYRKSPGTNSHGMVDSNYFIGGYAIHGYASVPTYAASHGCIRVPIAVARSIYDWISLGDTIFVYR